jgi:hypothetical protein
MIGSDQFNQFVEKLLTVNIPLIRIEECKEIGVIKTKTISIILLAYQNRILIAIQSSPKIQASTSA